MCCFSPPPVAVPSWKPLHPSGSQGFSGPGHPPSERPGAFQMLSWTRGGMGARGGAAGQGCWHARVGRTQRAELAASPASRSLGSGLSLPPHHLWDGVSLWQQTQIVSRQVMVMVLVTCERPVGAEPTKTPSPNLCWSRAWARRCLPLAPTAPRPLTYEPSAHLVGWWLLFNE